MYVLLSKLARLRHAERLPRGGRASCQLRHVDAGSCNGCEHELQAAGAPQYDLARFGFAITASPRHADVLLVTGPITTRMVEPLLRAHAAMPLPRLVAALGDCPLGHGPVCDPGEVVGSLAAVLPVDIAIPGCPPSPDQIARALDAGLRALPAARRPW